MQLIKLGGKFYLPFDIENPLHWEVAISAIKTALCLGTEITTNVQNELNYIGVNVPHEKDILTLIENARKEN